MNIPVIDIGPLLTPGSDNSRVIDAMEKACREMGFFYITGHGVDEGLQRELEEISWKFFNQPLNKKLEISMDRGGKAWRGYFPPEAELTSGRPDLKEGLYFAEDLPDHHPLVRAGIPLYGSNLYPDIEGFGQLIRRYMEQVVEVAGILIQGIARSLKLPADYFNQNFMTNPIKLFRIFHYPAPAVREKKAPQWGVGEHTDYGVLTILKQDDAGGLQVFSQGKWIQAPFIENSFVCNIGDMLDYLTSGYYRSTPHRVFNDSGKGRLSFPFFYDLDYQAVPRPLDLSHLGHTATLTHNRWDQSDLHSFEGTYGEYLIEKISKVFPKLRDNLL